MNRAIADTTDSVGWVVETLAAQTPPAQEPDEVVIRPRSGWIAVDWKELYHCPRALFFLVWRDVKIRYKQTVLGVSWAVLQPLCTMIISGHLRRGRGDQSDGVPYPVFVFAGSSHGRSSPTA